MQRECSAHKFSTHHITAARLTLQAQGADLRNAHTVEQGVVQVQHQHKPAGAQQTCHLAFSHTSGLSLADLRISKENGASWAEETEQRQVAGLGPELEERLRKGAQWNSLFFGPLLFSAHPGVHNTQVILLRLQAARQGNAGSECFLAQEFRARASPQSTMRMEDIY